MLGEGVVVLGIGEYSDRKMSLQEDIKTRKTVLSGEFDDVVGTMGREAIILKLSNPTTSV